MEIMLLQLLTSLALGTAVSVGTTQASRYINRRLSDKKEQEHATLDDFIVKPKPEPEKKPVVAKKDEKISDIMDRAMRH